MFITKATPADIPEINRLVNLAYRSEDALEKGWTSEVGLIDGIRISESILSVYFRNEAVTILKYTNEQREIVGVVYLEIVIQKLYMGMLSVSPDQQDKGIGKALLSAAEIFAKQHDCLLITITVVRNRKELISWYERHGYVFTSEVLPFDGDAGFGKPKQSLELIVLEKVV